MTNILGTRIHKLLLLALVITLVLLLSACQGSEEGAPPTTTKPVTFEGEVVVYVVGPMSGADAEKGQALAAGARFAAEELNQSGGLLKQKVIVKVMNDAGNPEGALQAAQKVASAAGAGERVIGVVIHEGSDPKLETVKQVYLSPGSGLNLLVVVPASTNPIPEGIGDERFLRLSAPSINQASETASILQGWNLPNTVVVYTSTDYGKALAEEFTDATKSLEIEVTASFEIAPGAVSYTDVVEQITDINPSAIFYAGGDAEAAVFLSELYGFEFQGTFVGSDQALEYTVVDELGCQAEGMYFTSVLPDPAAVMSSEQLANYAALEFREAELYSVAGYSGLEVIVQAFQQAGALDASQAADAARQTKIKTLMGEVSYDTQGNLLETKIHFLQVQSHRFKESFDQVVGAGPPVSEALTQERTTMLNISFDKDPIIFAGLNWGSAQFGNSIARFIIESGYGYPTYSVFGSSVPLFQSLRKGDVHVYMEVWLPNTQELYDKAIAKGQVVDVGLYFGDAVQGWFVPRYVVEGDPKRGIKPIAPDLNSIDDLEQFSQLFASKEQPGIGRLIDGSPGWFSSKIDCMKLKAYRLDDNYAQIVTGSLDALAAELRDAYEKGEPILVYMFGPSWPLASFDLKQIEEPEFTQERWSTDKGCAFPLNQVKIVVHSGLPQRAPEVADFFGRLSMDCDEISSILLTMKEKDLTPEEAGLLWLKENESVWSQWVPSDVAQRVKQALSEQ